MESPNVVIMTYRGGSISKLRMDVVSNLGHKLCSNGQSNIVPGTRIVVCLQAFLSFLSVLWLSLIIPPCGSVGVVCVPGFLWRRRFNGYHGALLVPDYWRWRR